MSTEDQRVAMLETLSQASEWMFEEGDRAETKVGEGVGCHDNDVLTAIWFSANTMISNLDQSLPQIQRFPVHVYSYCIMYLYVCTVQLIV